LAWAEGVLSRIKIPLKWEVLLRCMESCLLIWLLAVDCPSATRQHAAATLAYRIAIYLPIQLPIIIKHLLFQSTLDNGTQPYSPMLFWPECLCFYSGRGSAMWASCPERAPCSQPRLLRCCLHLTSTTHVEMGECRPAALAEVLASLPSDVVVSCFTKVEYRWRESGGGPAVVEQGVCSLCLRGGCRLGVGRCTQVELPQTVPHYLPKIPLRSNVVAV
jgi:hypothetical protein